MKILTTGINSTAFGYYLAKDSIDNKSLFTQLINALNSGDFATASSLQVEMYDKMEELKELYATYRNNMI